jgi:hypothetical protein
MERRPGGGAPKKWTSLEGFIVRNVQEAWERGMPLCSNQLLGMFQRHVKKEGSDDEIKLFVDGKKNTTNKFIHRVLKRNKFSIRKNSISQSVPVDWRMKAETNAARIRELFRAEEVDVVVNADETFVLFHMQDHRMIVPTGVKRVGTAAQVDNDKVGATVLIACEYNTSMIRPPMIIFTGVYGAKLMQQWQGFEEGNIPFLLLLCFVSCCLQLTIHFCRNSQGCFQ